MTYLVVPVLVTGNVNVDLARRCLSRRSSSQAKTPKVLREPLWKVGEQQPEANGTGCLHRENGARVGRLLAAVV